jgi:tetratricopeptide (TPR) repeat protein
MEYLQGRLVAAHEHFEAGLKTFQELNDQNGMGWVPAWLGCVAYRAGALDQARALIESSLAIHDPDGYWLELAFSLLSLGHVTRAQGDPGRAVQLYTRSLTMVVTNGMRPDKFQAVYGLRPDFAEYLEGFAKAAMLVGQPLRAARLFGAAQSLRSQFGPALPPVEQSEYGQSLAQLREQLNPPAFSAAWAEGVALSWEQAVAYAQES